MNATTTSPLSAIVERIYGMRPTTHLFHYATLGNVKNIVEGKQLWASDIRYMSDASELDTAARLIASVSANMLHAGLIQDAEVLHQFAVWVGHRFKNGHALFAACFSERGNLLSQWRGYCPAGNGYSLGFDPNDLAEVAKAQRFSLVRCIYDRDEQRRVLEEVVAAVAKHARAAGGTDAERHSDNRFYPAFESMESDLLKVAAALKHGAFFEEQEWRVVSEDVARTNLPEVFHRPGTSMLIPYVAFRLPTAPNGKLLLPHVYAGPTPHPNLAIGSLSGFLSSRVEGTRQITAADIPYRTW
ncbi:DUF2971 domain-containing protein [Variovorax sp. J22P271]|uniref:DUF2971 domain-containing protein n=1 Tax=Variovorax davisae TaxID=3053515 RepID=UPI00257691D0|nr:DUF2971 domain-containing protein [Variovorax sp. J22P271]MDM0031236.1 DUF2971 domain-containing protein [Variovorax sp. J22P271]